MDYHFSQSQVMNFEDNIRREWVLTNGIGGYAGSSIIGAHNRTHQGYLIASLHPPVERYMVFSKTNEMLSCGEKSFDLTCAMHADHQLTEGNRFLTSVDRGATVRFCYAVPDIELTKEIALVRGENSCVIYYSVKNMATTPAELKVVPLMNFREHSESSTVDSLRFTASCTQRSFTLIPEQDDSVRIQVLSSHGTFTEREEKFDVDMQLQTEVDNETDGLDTNSTPYELTVEIPGESELCFSLACSVYAPHAPKSALFRQEDTQIAPDIAKQCAESAKQRVNQLIEQAGYHDELADALVQAADDFLCLRQSTGLTTVLAGLPWFTDWGRDTMIAYTGLTLATKRFDEARDILRTFSMYIENGLVPNMFPDDGLDPIYNTADGSLWYFYAVYQYLQYVPTPEAFAFVKEEIYPGLVQIIEAHKKGTLFSIGMEENGLMHAGSGLDQVTWMDVRVGDWVATPRHGCPVEINALWYNALKVMEFLCNYWGEDASAYTELAEKVKESFCREFWNEEMHCLYDVVSKEGKDPSLRPNQIYAVSLPFTMLTHGQEHAIVDIVEQKLWAGTGLRSLGQEEKDYHPIYLGCLAKRDDAYHHGTSWGFLLGGFYTAYAKVHGRTKETAVKMDEMLETSKIHIQKEGCIGSISEIFDGDAPHTSRGCYAQAWSVGELLRCYTQDVLPFL